MTRVTRYHAAVSRIQSNAIFGVIAGLCAAWMGFHGEDWLSGALAVAGAVIVVDSLWVMRSPVSAGARPLGAALLIVEFYFFFRPKFSNGSLYAAIAAFAGALTTPPTQAQEAADRFEAEADEVRASTMAGDPAHVQFKSAGLFGRFLWDGRLRATDAVFAPTNISNGDHRLSERQQAFVVAIADVVIKTGHRHLFFGAERNARFHLGDRHLTGTIGPDALNRFRRWKQSPP